MTAAELNPELRKLIDARLEAIDAILVSSQVAWSERRNIVGEVETQIFELLSRRSPTPTQEDVLAVLAGLDPPESYLPEEPGEGLADAPSAGMSPQPQWRQWPQQTVRVAVQFIPVALGAVALLIVNGIVIAIIAATEGVIPWLVTVGGLAWLNYMGVQRFRAWSATRHGRFVDDLRHSLAAWLLSNNGATAA